MQELGRADEVDVRGRIGMERIARDVGVPRVVRREDRAARRSGRGGGSRKRRPRCRRARSGGWSRSRRRPCGRRGGRRGVPRGRRTRRPPRACRRRAGSMPANHLCIGRSDRAELQELRQCAHRQHRAERTPNAHEKRSKQIRYLDRALGAFEKPRSSWRGSATDAPTPPEWCRNPSCARRILDAGKSPPFLCRRVEARRYLLTS